jgi:hypothetical protein
MLSIHLNESSIDDYHRTIHTGELPKAKPARASKKPVKSFDDLHKEVSGIRKVETRNGQKFELHHSTSSTKVHSLLKNSGWTHHSGSHVRYGYNSSVTYKHPDGHTLTYNHDAHSLTFKKKD